MGAEVGQRHDAIDVVVVSYNSRAALRGCVAPLAGQPGLNVIVVDNASDDESLEAVRDLPLEAVAAAANRGFAAGCNIGWRRGSASSVLFLNPDARIAVDDVRRLAEVFRKPRVGLAAPRILGENGKLQFSLRRFPTVRSTYAQALFLHRLSPRSTWTDEVVRDPAAYRTAHAVDWASGACLLVRRSLLEALQGLDEDFFMYCEDADLCKRAADKGYTVHYDPTATTVHVGGQSAPRAPLLPVLADSRCRYARKHEPRAKAAITRTGIALGAVTHALISRGGIAARAGQVKALRAVLRPALER